jgi:hypothetical protein
MSRTSSGASEVEHKRVDARPLAFGREGEHERSRHARRKPDLSIPGLRPSAFQSALAA